MKIFLFKMLSGGLVFSIGISLGIWLIVKAAGLTATSGSPLTASNWNNMVNNFFWGSGNGGIFYNGKIGIGINAPNKDLHIYDTTNNAEIDLQSIAGTNKHWAIYQDKINSNLYMWSNQNNVAITSGGNMDVLGKVNGIGGLCINGNCKTNWNQIGSSVSNAYTGSCDSAHRGATGVINGFYKICNGLSWINILQIDNYFIGDGGNINPYRKFDETASANTVIATSCNYYNLNATTLNEGIDRGSGTCGGGTKGCLNNGIYLIDPDGAGGNNAFKVYCDMTADGGGWTLLHLYNSADITNTFYQINIFASDNNAPLSTNGSTGTHNWNKFSNIITASTLLRYTNNKTSIKRFETNITLSYFLSAPVSCSSITIIGGDNNGTTVDSTPNGTFSTAARGNGRAYMAFGRGNSCAGSWTDAEGLGLRYIMLNSGLGYNPLVGNTAYDFSSNSIIVYVSLR